MSLQVIKQIGVAVQALLAYARLEALELTIAPIEVTEEGTDDQYVTLHACRGNGDDVHIRAAVTAAGIVNAEHRVWDAVAGRMTDWSYFDRNSLYAAYGEIL